MNDAKTSDSQKLQIFRHADAPGLMEAGLMSVNPYTSDAAKEGMREFVEAGFLEGEGTRVLINIPGFSLVYVWFKKDYPLPLHSHDSDCLYYVIAGSLKLGTETLGPRDGFFIKADVPYSYQVGPEGVELLEFRHETAFDFTNFANNATFYTRGVEAIRKNVEDWKTDLRPSEHAVAS